MRDRIGQITRFRKVGCLDDYHRSLLHRVLGGSQRRFSDGLLYICQTSTVTPAEPGDFLFLVKSSPEKGSALWKKVQVPFSRGSPGAVDYQNLYSDMLGIKLIRLMRSERTNGDFIWPPIHKY